VAASGRIELHTHLEGALSPARLLVLAERYGQPGIPGDVLAGDGLGYRFGDFHEFIEVYRAITSLLRTPADFHAVALDLAAALAADGVAYAEVIVGYGVMLRREIDPLPVQKALAEAAAAAEAAHGVVVRWIPDAVRQFGVDAAWRAAEAAAFAGRELGVVGFGLGGDETAAGPEPFAPLLEEMRAEGLGVAIHAGEVAGPESVRGAVLDCGAVRIGHGIGAAADGATMDLLAARGVFVELCPRSNLRTGAVASAAAHPLRRFVERGIPCCLNTDDRALFGLDLAGEYAWAAEHHALSEVEVAAMERAALAAAFCGARTRREVGRRLAGG
jgi:adenosine deaminase